MENFNLSHVASIRHLVVAFLTTHIQIYMLQDGSTVSMHSGEKTLKCDACLFIVVVTTRIVKNYSQWLILPVVYQKVHTWTPAVHHISQ